MRSLWALPFGVLGVMALNAALQTYGPSLIPAAGSDIPIIGYGVVLILVLLFLPGGLAAGAQRVWRAAAGGKSAGKEQAVAPKVVAPAPFTPVDDKQ